MLMPSNEHVNNVNAKLTHNAKCVICTHSYALKKHTIIEIHVCLCIVHYAFKEGNKLCVISTSSSEHARSANAKFTHNT